MRKEYRKPAPMLILPILWQEVRPPNADVQRAYAHEALRPTFVIVGEEKIEGRWWRHVSCSQQDQVPPYDMIMQIKQIFIGNSSKAIQVFPAADEHVNCHPHTLHLWGPLDHDPLPDFREVIDGHYLI